MEIKKNFRNFLIKLQSLPENTKKIILFLVVGVLTLVLSFFWFKITVNRLNDFQKQKGGFFKDINLPDLKEGFSASGVKNLEELEKIKNLIKNLEENQEKLKELEKMIDEDPNRAAEIILDSEKLKEFLNF